MSLIVLYGEAGAGKTTTAFSMAKEAIEQAGYPRRILVVDTEGKAPLALSAVGLQDIDVDILNLRQIQGQQWQGSLSTILTRIREGSQGGQPYGGVIIDSATDIWEAVHAAVKGGSGRRQISDWIGPVWDLKNFWWQLANVDCLVVATMRQQQSYQKVWDERRGKDVLAPGPKRPAFKEGTFEYPSLLITRLGWRNGANVGMIQKSNIPTLAPNRVIPAEEIIQRVVEALHILKGGTTPQSSQQQGQAIQPHQPPRAATTAQKSSMAPKPTPPSKPAGQEKPARTARANTNDVGKNRNSQPQVQSQAAVATPADTLQQWLNAVPAERRRKFAANFGGAPDADASAILNKHQEWRKQIPLARVIHTLANNASEETRQQVLGALSLPQTLSKEAAAAMLALIWLAVPGKRQEIEKGLRG